MTTWMDLEGLMVSEANQTEKDKYFMISLIHGIKQNNNENPIKLIEKEIRGQGLMKELEEGGPNALRKTSTRDVQHDKYN